MEKKYPRTQLVWIDFTITGTHFYNLEIPDAESDNEDWISEEATNYFDDLSPKDLYEYESHFDGVELDEIDIREEK